MLSPAEGCSQPALRRVGRGTGTGGAEIRQPTEFLEDSKELLRSSTRLGLKIPREMRMAQAGTGGPGSRSRRAEGPTPGWPEPAQTTPGYSMKHILVPMLPSL